MIVTENQKDFPAETLPSPLFTQSIDTLLLDSFDLQPTLVTEAVQTVTDRSGRNRPRRTAKEVTAMLDDRGCPHFAAAILTRIEP